MHATGVGHGPGHVRWGGSEVCVRGCEFGGGVFLAVLCVLRGMREAGRRLGGMGHFWTPSCGPTTSRTKTDDRGLGSYTVGGPLVRSWGRWCHRQHVTSWCQNGRLLTRVTHDTASLFDPVAVSVPMCFVVCRSRSSVWDPRRSGLAPHSSCDRCLGRLSCRRWAILPRT